MILLFCFISIGIRVYGCKQARELPRACNHDIIILFIYFYRDLLQADLQLAIALGASAMILLLYVIFNVFRYK